jgi:hypothetical protein
MAHREDKHTAKVDFAAYPMLAWDLVSEEAIHRGWRCHDPDTLALERELLTAVGPELRERRSLPRATLRGVSLGEVVRPFRGIPLQWHAAILPSSSPPRPVIGQSTLSLRYIREKGKHRDRTRAFPCPTGVPQSMPHVHGPVKRPRFEESTWPLSGERHHASLSSLPHSPSSAYQPATALLCDVWFHIPRPYSRQTV